MGSSPQSSVRCIEQLGQVACKHPESDVDAVSHESPRTPFVRSSQQRCDRCGLDTRALVAASPNLLHVKVPIQELAGFRLDVSRVS